LRIAGIFTIVFLAVPIHSYTLRCLLLRPVLRLILGLDYRLRSLVKVLGTYLEVVPFCDPRTVSEPCVQDVIREMFL
jgi:hypothetical protein